PKVSIGKKSWIPFPLSFQVGIFFIHANYREVLLYCILLNTASQCRYLKITLPRLLSPRRSKPIRWTLEILVAESSGSYYKKELGNMCMDKLGSCKKSRKITYAC